MKTKFMKINEVIDIIGLSRATIYRLIGKNKFPSPYTLSTGRVGWLSEEIIDWMDNRKNS